MRLYTAEFHNVSVTAQQDFFYLKPAADKPIKLHSVFLSNVGGNLDAGDAQEELYRIEYIYLPSTVTVGSGGGAFTPTPLLVNDAAAGFTARINDTVVATTSGTAVNRHSDGMNIRVPYVYLPPPEHRHVIANAAALVVRLVSTPADAVLMSGTAYVEELVQPVSTGVYRPAWRRQTPRAYRPQQQFAAVATAPAAAAAPTVTSDDAKKAAAVTYYYSQGLTDPLTIFNRDRILGEPWNGTGAGTNAGVTVTKAAVAGQRHVVTHISGSGDAAALVTIESPAATVIWRKRFSAAFTFGEVFPPGEYTGASNVAVLVKISASTANCEANLAGFDINAS